MKKGVVLRSTFLAIAEDGVTVELRLKCGSEADADELFEQLGKGLQSGSMTLSTGKPATVVKEGRVQ